MIDHQHSVLRTMGIDLWIPRETVCVDIATTSLWRDQAPPEQNNTVTTLPQTIELPIVDLAQDVIPTRLARTIPNQPLQQSKSEIVQSVEQDKTALSIEALLSDLSDTPVCAPFQLQALVLPQYTLVVESTRFNETHWALWQNIQQALSATSRVLEWPFPLLPMQDARGVACYVQGFLDATGLEQKVFILGELPYVQIQAHWEKMPEIQQLLDQPVLKKQLWQRLYRG